MDDHDEQDAWSCWIIMIRTVTVVVVIISIVEVVLLVYRRCHVLVVKSLAWVGIFFRNIVNFHQAALQYPEGSESTLLQVSIRCLREFNQSCCTMKYMSRCKYIGPTVGDVATSTIKFRNHSYKSYWIVKGCGPNLIIFRVGPRSFVPISPSLGPVYVEYGFYVYDLA